MFEKIKMKTWYTQIEFIQQEDSLQHEVNSINLKISAEEQKDKDIRKRWNY